MPIGKPVKVLVLLAALAGCGAPPPPGTSSNGSGGGSGYVPNPSGSPSTSTPQSELKGTVGGTSLQVKEAFFFPYVANGTVLGTSLVLSSVSGLCDELRAGRMFSNVTVASVTFFEKSSTGYLSEAHVGTWSVITPQNPPAGQWAYGKFSTTDSTCQPVKEVGATSGFVSIDSYDKAVKRQSTGTFDITWGADRTTGTFTAAYCDLPNGLASNTTCSPQR